MAEWVLTVAVAPPDFPVDLSVAPIPRISLSTLSTGDTKESARLFDACCDQGFFLLDLTKDETGIVVLDDVEKAFQIGQEFFASDLATKEAFKLSTGNVGYKPLGKIKHKDGKSDLTEICAVGRDSILDSQQSSIPQVYQRERAQLQTTVSHLHEIATCVLKVLCQHVDIPFPVIEAMHRLDAPSSTVLRFLHNPPQEQNAPREERQLSLLGHTDNGSLTILFTRIGGLQVLPVGANEDDESAWLWVRPEPNCAIINVGDSLVQWTGGVLTSALHRVLYAPGAQAQEDRYSWGYFLKPADDALMDRLQIGNVIPRQDKPNPEEEILPYKIWHQNKTKKIMQGHQQGVFRGGIRRPVDIAGIGA